MIMIMDSGILLKTSVEGWIIYIQRDVMGSLHIWGFQSIKFLLSPIYGHKSANEESTSGQGSPSQPISQPTPKRQRKWD